MKIDRNFVVKKLKNDSLDKNHYEFYNLQKPKFISLIKYDNKEFFKDIFGKF